MTLGPPGERWQTPPMRRCPAGEAWWFGGATAVCVVHALDDAVVDRQPGVPADQHLAAVVLTVALAIVAVVAVPHARTGLRAKLAMNFGVLALANGMLHVIHIGSLGGPARSDVTGVLAAAAGVALVALSVWIPFHH